jgi:Arc/MetJ-type ribon-helix-helix transcriptional regulator
MNTRELLLPPDIAAQLDERVANGEAANAVEVVRSALAALEAEDARKLDAVRAKIERSLADTRPVVPADTVFDRIDQLIGSFRKR